MLEVRALPAGAPLRIVLGAGAQRWPGWIATQREDLDLARRDDWVALFGDRRIDALLCEHVWEHLSEAEGRAAAALCYEFLRPGGYLRVAVPDANFPDAEYQRTRRGGGGPGRREQPAVAHQIAYHYRRFSAVFADVGFVVALLEWCDELGHFHFNYWDPADGPIARSLRTDPRNRDGKLGSGALILDAKKPAQYS